MDASNHTLDPVNTTTAINMSFSITFFLILVYIGLIFLQLFLSRKNNKWYGIIIPVINFFFSILFSIYISTNFLITTNFLMLLFLLILFNIPTAIYLIIYAICRENIKKRKIELDKINIQNLN